MALPVAAGLAAIFSYFIGHNLKTIVFRVMSTLGLGIITYGGTQLLVGQMYDYVRDGFNAIPAEYLQVIGMLRIDVFMSMVISAYAIRYTIGLTKKIGVRKK